MFSEDKDIHSPLCSKGALEFLRVIRNFDHAALENIEITCSSSDLARIAGDYQTLSQLTDLLYRIIPPSVKACSEYRIPKKESIEQNPAALYDLTNRLFEELPKYSMTSLSSIENDTVERWRYLLYNVLGNCSESILNSSNIFYTTNSPTIDRQSDIAKSSLELMEKDTPVVERLFSNLPNVPRIVRSVADIERIVEKNSFTREQKHIGEQSSRKEFSLAQYGKLMKVFSIGVVTRVLDSLKKRNKTREEDEQKKHKQKVISLCRTFFLNIVPPVMGAVSMTLLRIPLVPSLLMGIALFYCYKFIKDRKALGSSGTPSLTACDDQQRRVHIARSSKDDPAKYAGKIESQDRNFYQQMCVTSPMVVLDRVGNLEPLNVFIQKLPDKEKQVLSEGLYRTHTLRLFDFDGSNNIREEQLEEGETRISLEVKDLTKFSLPLPVNYAISSLQIYLGVGDERVPFPVFEKYVTECRLGGAQIETNVEGIKSKASVTYTIKRNHDTNISSEVQNLLNRVLPKPAELTDESSKDIETALHIAGVVDEQKIPILFRNFSKGMVYSKDRVTGTILFSAKENLYEAVRGIRSGTCDVFAFGLNQLFRFHDVPSIVIQGYTSEKSKYAFLVSEGHAQNCVIHNDQATIFDVTEKAETVDPFRDVGWIKKTTAPYFFDYKSPEAVYLSSVDLRSAHTSQLVKGTQMLRADFGQSDSSVALIDDVLMFERMLSKYKENPSFAILNQVSQFGYNFKNNLLLCSEDVFDDSEIEFFTNYNLYTRFCQAVIELSAKNFDKNRLLNDAERFFSSLPDVFSTEEEDRKSLRIFETQTLRSLFDLIDTFQDIEIKQDLNSSILIKIAMFIGAHSLRDEANDLTKEDAKTLIQFIQRTVESRSRRVIKDWKNDYPSMLLRIAKKFPELRAEIVECADAVFSLTKNPLPMSLKIDSELLSTVQEQSPELCKEILSRWIPNCFMIMAANLGMRQGEVDLRNRVDFDIFKIDNLQQYGEIPLSVTTEIFLALKQKKAALKNDWEDWGLPDIESPIKRYCLHKGEAEVGNFYELVYELDKNRILLPSQVADLLPEVSEEDLVERQLSKMVFLTRVRSTSKKSTILSAMSYPLTLHYLLSNQLSKQTYPNLIANNISILALCALKIAEQYSDMEPRLFRSDMDTDERQRDLALYEVLKKFPAYDFSSFNDPKIFEAFLLDSIFSFSENKEAYIGELVREVLQRDDILRDKEPSVVAELQKFREYSTEDILVNSEHVQSLAKDAIHKVVPTWNEVLYGSLSLPVQLRFVTLVKDFSRKNQEDMLDFLLQTSMPEIRTIHPSVDRIKQIYQVGESQVPFFGKWTYGSFYSDAWFNMAIRFPLVFGSSNSMLEMGAELPQHSTSRTIVHYSSVLGQRNKSKYLGDDEFDRIIAYEPGMDARRINANASARTGSLQVNHFEDLKELGTTFLIDMEWLGDFPGGHDGIFAKIEGLFNAVHHALKAKKEVNIILAVRGAYYQVPNVARLFADPKNKNEFFDAVALLGLQVYQTAFAEASLDREASVAPIDKLSLLKLSTKCFKNRKVILAISDLHKPSFAHSIGWLQNEASGLSILK